MKDIKLGYEIGTGKVVSISPSHLIVTGISQRSGKTTTLEALIKRSNLKAIVFKTKIGEKSFTQGTEIPPFFRDRSDYEFVRSLIEAYTKEKLYIEKGTLMQLCKGSASLVEIKRRVDDQLATGKTRGIKEEIYVRLQHYLENLIPQVQYGNLSKVLAVYDGINIMNLERFTEEAQSLIIQSVADEVLKTMKDVILVIPETWKFLPQKYNNPCKRVVESFIRQGAANNNFIFLDSQDLAGVDKSPLKQVSTWIMGYQAERNEVKHTLDQIPLPNKMKPREDEIMTLKKGHFYVATINGVQKVYVQPAWLEDSKAIAVAKGELSVDAVVKPDNLVPYAVQPIERPGVDIRFDDSKIRKEVVELRNDFFNKIQEMQTAINNCYVELYNVKTLAQQSSNSDEIVSKVLQKLTLNGGGLNIPTAPQPVINEDALIAKILQRIPQGSGGTVFEVAPLEKIKKNFQEEVKNKILGDIENLSPDEKKVLKYLESMNRDVAPSEIVTKCLLLKIGGSQSTKVSKILGSLKSIEVVEKTPGSRYRGSLKPRIQVLMGNHSATEQEIENVYNHILAGLLK